MSLLIAMKEELRNEESDISLKDVWIVRVLGLNRLIMAKDLLWFLCL